MSKPIVIHVLKKSAAAEITAARASIKGTGYKIVHEGETSNCTIDLSTFDAKTPHPFYPNAYVIVGVKP